MSSIHAKFPFPVSYFPSISFQQQTCLCICVQQKSTRALNRCSFVAGWLVLCAEHRNAFLILFLRLLRLFGGRMDGLLECPLNAFFSSMSLRSRFAHHLWSGCELCLLAAGLSLCRVQQLVMSQLNIKKTP